MRAPEVIKDEIIKQLTTVVDPELGIDIVNMGFVYSIDLDEDGICLVELTLEILGCPLEIVLAKMIKEVLVKIPEVKNVDVEFRAQPRWTKERISATQKENPLGFSFLHLFKSLNSFTCRWVSVK